MNRRLPLSLRPALAAALLLAGVARAQPQPGSAADDEVGNVFPRSATGKLPTPPTGGPLDTLELRGAMPMSDGQTTVVLFDTANSRSIVVNVDQTVNGIRVVSYESGEKLSAVVVEAGGKSRRIQMKEASIVPVAVAPPPPVVVAGGPAVPAGAPPGAVGGMSDQEVRERMARVAEEIRRRRAMRREMLENAQPPPPPNLPPGQQQQ